MAKKDTGDSGTSAPARPSFAFAYNLLFEQQAVVQPGLTPEQFEKWVQDTVAAKVKAARKDG